MKKNTTEFFFVLYIYMFTLLKPVFYYSSVNSTNLLLLGALAILALDFVKKPRFGKEVLVWLVWLVFFVVIFGSRIFFENNYLLKSYATNFVIYALIPIFLMKNVQDFKAVLKYTVIFSIAVGIILITDPLNDYAITGDYMIYGFNMLQFSFSGLLVGIFYFKRKILILPATVELFFIVFYSNKGAVIAAVALLAFALLASSKSKKSGFLVLVVCVFGVVYYEKIILWFIDLAKSFGIESYSMTTFKIMLSKNSDVIYSTRTDIWKKVFNFIEGNKMFGCGIAAFEATMGNYPHNIWLDVLSTFGYFGLCVFVVLVVCSLEKLMKSKNTELKIFQSGCFVCWMVTLQFSMTFWSSNLFWIYWGIFFYGFLNKKVGNGDLINEDIDKHLQHSVSK